MNREQKKKRLQGLKAGLKSVIETRRENFRLARQKEFEVAEAIRKAQEAERQRRATLDIPTSHYSAW